MPKLRNGHAPGHVRQAFCDAIDAFLEWDGQKPEPSVFFETNYVPQKITISQACSLVWNCNDVMPWTSFCDFREVLSTGRQTYAACAQAMLAEIKTQK